MAEMTRIERVLTTLEGNQPDHPPVSFWHHFPPDCAHGQAALDAHLRHLTRYNLDLLKVMNDNPYPANVEIKKAADLRNLAVLAGDEEGYVRQLTLLRALKAELSGEVLMVTTLFNAWAVLRRMATPAITNRHGPPTLGGPPTPADVRMTELIAEDRDAVSAGLKTVAASQANFARRCIEAGADGIFLSVRDSWVNTDAHGQDTYEEMVRSPDMEILGGAAEARCNMLHVCGVPQNLESFATYPVEIINWADRAAGPAIADVIHRIKPVVCGGVDNLGTLLNGKPGDVEHEVRDAMEQAGDRPLVIAPGCTYDPDLVPTENLEAMVRAARSS